MNFMKILGILSIVLGLIFVIFPLFSAELVSLFSGISLIVFGIVFIIEGFFILRRMAVVSIIEILLGICAILFGALFIYRIDALSFMIGFQFYLVAFVLIFIGLMGVFTGPVLSSKITSLLILILGIITVFLAAFSMSQPLFVAIFVGISLIIEGISLFTVDVIES